MALARFSVIVAVDAAGGIAKDGKLPWASLTDAARDRKMFRDITFGKGRNAIIMGRLTYESINSTPLEGRKNFVISRTLSQANNPEIGVYPSLLEALSGIGATKAYETIFIMGGESLYHSAVTDFAYLCDKIYVTKFKTDYSCTQFFPIDIVEKFPRDARNELKIQAFVHNVYLPGVVHEELQYLNLLTKVLDTGENKMDRTKVGTKSLFGERLEFDLRERLPVITTKKVNYEHIIKELLFFISGKTDTKILEHQGVNIWKGNTSKAYLKEHNLPWAEGDMGAGYGWQWRHYGAKYEGYDKDYTGQGIDQLSNLVKDIRENPHSRRHLLMAWNPTDLDKMALPPCHFGAQFNVSEDKLYLDCQLYQRSADLFLGVPYNITSYAMLTHIIGLLTDLKPRKLICIFGDTHIYNNHVKQVRTQISRTPRPFPRLKFRDTRDIKTIDDVRLDHFNIENYWACPTITAEMAI